MTDAPSDSVVWGAVGLSIGGLLVHNLTEFPADILISVETLFPVLVTIAIGWLMVRRPSRMSFALAAAWALIVVVFGGGSVLPLSVLPFEPEQSLGHYMAHVVYGACQVPLLWVAWRGLRRTD